jgi:RNA polymerase primary sigma factor
MQAIDEYNPDKGTRFLTFAVWYIRRSMNYYLENTTNMIVRSNNTKLSKKIETIKEEYFREFGTQPTEDTIVDLIRDKYDIDVKDVRDVYDVNVSSISEEIDDDYTVEDNSEYNQKTASENGYEKDIEKDYTLTLIGELLSILPEEKADIIKMSYGIGYDRVYSLTEIGQKYDMYPEDVADLKKKIMKYLKQESRMKIAV